MTARPPRSRRRSPSSSATSGSPARPQGNQPRRRARATPRDGAVVLGGVLGPCRATGVDERLVVYPHWESVGRQPPTVLRLFPIAPEGVARTSGVPPLFEPSAEEILDRLLPLYGRQLMYAVLPGAVAAGQVARRIANARGTDNASAAEIEPGPD